MQTEEKQMTFNEFKIAELRRNYEMKRAVEIVLLVYPVLCM